MDNYTHSLAGWALGQAGLKTKTRKGLAALILGANMPDIDVFFGWVPWQPLAMHRGFTHGLVGGVILMPPMLAGLLWLLDRWQQGRQRAGKAKPFGSGLHMHLGWLVALAYIGTLTHPLLDLQTTYAVQLLSPFSTRWFHAETLFIIDVWIWAGLSFAIYLSRRRERSGGAWRTPAIAGLIGVCAYIGLNGAISLLARDALYADLAPVRPRVAIANEQPVIFWRRSLVWSQQGGIGRAEYDPLWRPGRITDRQPLVPDNMNDPLVRRAMASDPAITAFLRWSILPLAQVRQEACVAVVSFGDARFGVAAGSSRLTRQVTVPTGGTHCPQILPGR
jgi:inner membrane protein